MFGLVGLMPDYSMIIVGSNMGVSRMTKEHLGISLALKIPIFIVITKIDLPPSTALDSTKEQLTKILKSPGCGRSPIVIKNDTDLIPVAQAMDKNRVCPIFCCSNVTGEGLPKIKEFLSLLTSRIHSSGQFKAPTEPVEFLIDGIYQVTGVGLVVSGTMKSGTVVPNTTLQLGPDKTGQFRPVMVKCIHHKRVSVETCKSGQAVCFLIKSLDKKYQLKRNVFRKGMVLLDKAIVPQIVTEFEAEVVILHHATTIK